MEDPRTWGLAEQVVNQAIEAHQLDETSEEIEDPRIGGLSLAKSITDALRSAGLLVEEEGTDTVEYGVQKNGEEKITVPNSNTLGYGTMATAQELADKYGDTVFVRERTTYPDKVTEWRAVGGLVGPPFEEP